MARFRDIKNLQKFTAVHALIHNHFNHQRHFNGRDIFKQHRAAALADWRPDSPRLPIRQIRAIYSDNALGNIFE